MDTSIVIAIHCDNVFCFTVRQTDGRTNRLTMGPMSFHVQTDGGMKRKSWIPLRNQRIQCSIFLPLLDERTVEETAFGGGVADRSRRIFTTTGGGLRRRDVNGEMGEYARHDFVAYCSNPLNVVQQQQQVVHRKTRSAEITYVLLFCLTRVTLSRLFLDGGEGGGRS